MTISVNEIRKSGLLELYVIGEVTYDELKKVEIAIELFEELKDDIIQIERALYTYAVANEIQAPYNL